MTDTQSAEGTQSARVFVGLRVAPPTAQALAELARPLEPHGARLVLSRDIHLTLVPPWNEADITEAVEKLRDALIAVPRFVLNFTHLRYGPTSRSPRLLWVDCANSSELAELRMRLLAAYGRGEEQRPFKPHVTLARLPRGGWVIARKNPIDQALSLTQCVASVELFRSPPKGETGYQVLASLALGPPERFVKRSMMSDVDVLRRLQGDALDALGFGPSECAYHTTASGPKWRLRSYGEPGAAPSLLIVAAPIKRPYIWDLAPWVSAIRRCLEARLRVFLLEWLAPTPGDANAGLEGYAGRAIGEAIAACSRETGGAKPVLIGHSLGGTLAAIFAAKCPSSIRGLILLSSPLCFAAGSSRFRDALVAIAPSSFAMEVIPGTLLSQLSAIASPEIFIWSRLADAGLCIGDPRALEVHARVERWSLDEVPLSGQLVSEMLRWLYREDRLCKGTLQIGGKTVQPSSLRVRTLSVVSRADEIAPRGSVLPFLNQIPSGFAQLIEHQAEIGVCFQHLSPLIGRHAHASIWPKIISWLHDLA